ncbi:hypothetical protein PAXRUDRAFT_179004 [Paxillus rubicundulus Ve08.2h10]|uniref:Uncharacterized protein n=1 Tax=Paxillus rubicundulus Ve08.2h10 TaxID=930991 RepID=A0A0D0BNS5_9AGAM|nr:hypothetical protein PAXRUDRAFT_179004 [Paxillus rubicundulus Ve08.2h10]
MITSVSVLIIGLGGIASNGDPWKCSICNADRIYRYLGCFSQPLFCMQCCWQQNYMLPFH